MRIILHTLLDGRFTIFLIAANVSFHSRRRGSDGLLRRHSADVGRLLDHRRNSGRESRHRIIPMDSKSSHEKCGQCGPISVAPSDRRFFEGGRARVTTDREKCLWIINTRRKILNLLNLKYFFSYELTGRGI